LLNSLLTQQPTPGWPMGQTDNVSLSLSGPLLQPSTDCSHS